MHWTAQQVYGGLAAMYVMHDRQESTLLPTGDFDIPLMVSDAMFAADGSLAFNDTLHSGLWGDVILVNGRPWPVMKVQRRTYRFRVLNCSIARSYNWRLSNGGPLQVVATDGGLMPQGVAVTSMRHAAAERYEIVIDFSQVPATTTRIELLNGSNENNIDYDFTGQVMAFDLLDEPVTTTRANYDNPTIQEPDPTWNRDYQNFPLVRCEIMDLPVDGSYRRRHFRVKRDNLVWTIGGMTWDAVVDSGFTRVMADPEIGDVEIWEIENSSGGWFHPVHLHLVDFRIIGRTGGVGQVLPYEEGPKDVMYVGEGETVHVLVKFNKPGVVAPSGDPDFKGGRYMVHCHNLPHEDHDMMGQFSVGAIGLGGLDPHHPIDAARPSVLTVPGSPTIGTATPGNASVLVRFSPPVNDGGWPVTGYSVSAFAGTALVRTQAVTGDVDSLVVTGLTNATAYTFDVAAVNAGGTGPSSARSLAVTPRAEFVAPTIMARTPAPGARSVSQTGNVTMTFSEPVTGVTSGTFVLRLGTTAIPAVVSHNATTRVATLNPNATLLADRVYAVSFSSIRDAAGNLLAPSPWSFTTGPAPRMTASSPASGAKAVRRNSNVTATFSEPITGFNTTTVRITRVSTGVVVPGTVAYNATTRVLTINPGTSLASNVQCRVTITGGTRAVRDLAGNPLVTRAWVFTTGTVL